MSSPQTHIAHRRLATLGLAGATIITVGTTIAAVSFVGAQEQRYSLLDHWISEPGSAQSEAALAFNLSLIVGGPLLALFMVGLGRIISGGWGGAIAVSGAVVGVLAWFVAVSAVLWQGRKPDPR